MSTKLPLELLLSLNLLAIFLPNYVISLLQFCKLSLSWDVHLCDHYMFFNTIGLATFETHSLRLLISLNAIGFWPFHLMIE